MIGTLSKSERRIGLLLSAVVALLELVMAASARHGAMAAPGATSLLKPHHRRKEIKMTQWLPTLQTDTPEEGYELAVKLSRVAVKLTQPDAEVRERLRPEYAEDAESLIAVSQVVATHFATVAAANGFWRNKP